MKHFYFFAIAFVVISSVSSCSHRLVGTWNISRYEATNTQKQTMSLNNIGTMQFFKNGNGEKDVNYSVFGMKKQDQTPFGWHATGSFVTIESRNSEFSKTWIVTENKKRYQKWKSTDGGKGVQILELKK